MAEKKKIDLKKLGETVEGLAGSAGKAASNVAEKTKAAVTKSKTALVGAIDQNGNG